MNRIWWSGVCKKGIKDKRSVTNTLALVNLSNNRKKSKTPFTGHETTAAPGISTSEAAEASNP